MSWTTHGIREPQFLSVKQHRQQQFTINMGPLAGHIPSLKGDSPWV